MGFVDLFRPRWKHSKPSTRKKAVSQLDDATILRQVAVDDVDPEVRRVAVRKIDEQEFLISIAREDATSPVRREAVGKITDESVLAEIACSDPDDTIRHLAVRQINDEVCLQQVVNSHNVLSVRENAIARISDNEFLCLIVRSDSDDPIRQAALTRCTDQTLLTEVAMGTDPLSLKRTALLAITDQGFLLDYIASTDDETLAQAAVHSVADPKCLERIATTHESPAVQMAAIGRIEDDRMLLSIVASSTHAENRLAAIKHIGDQELLAGLVKGDTDAMVRKAALACISNQQVVGAVASEARFEDARLLAVQKLDNAQVLQAVAENAEFDDARQLAAERLKTQLLPKQYMSLMGRLDGYGDALRQARDELESFDRDIPTYPLIRGLRHPRGGIYDDVRKTLRELGYDCKPAEAKQLLFRAEPRTRGFLAQVLARLGEPEWTEWIKGDSGDFERLRASESKDVRALLETVEKEVHVLVDKLGRRPFSELESTCRKLGQIGHPTAAACLQNILKDRWKYYDRVLPSDMGALTEALGHIGDPSTVPALIEYISCVRLEAIEVSAELLKSQGDTSHEAAMQMVLHTTPIQNGVQNGIEALARIGSDEAIDYLKKISHAKVDDDDHAEMARDALLVWRSECRT